MIEWLRFGICAFFVLLSLVAFGAAQVGLQKWSFVLCRMHAVAVGDTVGFLSLLLAVAIALGFQLATLKLALIALVWLFASPTAGHLLAQLQCGSSGVFTLPTEKEEDDHAN